MPGNPFGANGFMTKFGERIPGVNNVIQDLHRKAGQEEALKRAQKKNPVGADGAITRAAEHVPGVNDLVQKLHEKAGQEQALKRAQQKNPIGADGAITQVAEHIPGVNEVVQKLHKNAGNEEARVRAREANPIGAHGAITKVVEHVPVVNEVVQQLHKNAGQKDAAARAADVNPIGANGIITQIGEQIPIVNDGIYALHKRAGQHTAAERTKAHTLGDMLSKDGALTKVAEVLPGSNFVAAAVHEMKGNHEEAKRACNLLKNWQEIGSADGALAKVAELIPGADVVAFGAHLNAGHYAHALRAATKAHEVMVESKGVMILVKAGCLEGLELLNLDVLSVEIKPHGLSILGGLMDMALHFAKVDKHGAARKRHGRRLKLKQHAENQIMTEGNELLKSLCLESLNDTISSIIAGIIENVPVIVNKTVEQIDKQVRECREKSTVVRLLTPERLPKPNTILAAAIQRAIKESTLVHGSVKKAEHLNPREPPHTPYKLGSKKGGAEATAALACLCFLAKLFSALARNATRSSSFFKLDALWAGSDFLGALGVFMAVVSGFSVFRRWARRHVIPMINAVNLSAWHSVIQAMQKCEKVKAKEVNVPSAEKSLVQAVEDLAHKMEAKVDKTAGEEATSSENVLHGPPAMLEGVVYELQPDDVKCISKLARRYVFKEYYKSHILGKIISLVEPFARNLADDFTEKAGTTVPFVLNVPLEKMQIVEEPLDLWLPDFEVALMLDLRFGGKEAYVTRARVAIPDVVLDKIIDALCDQIKDRDLRLVDDRLSQFREPIKLYFEFARTWPDPERLRMEIKNLKTQLYLPK